MMLCGKPPFEGEESHHVYAAIRFNKVDFSQPIWKRISPQAREFVELALHKDSDYRASAATLLSHAWLSETHATSQEQKSQTYANKMAATEL